ncbi:hypothetical protein [Marinobacter sp. SS21]|uniref:hypothetical protein n=1 Tax=Marinobacter sp. SS21 TaxID=2979460 RepID=UPI00232A96CB|nr:hypothetical protein [Marinobacter sp. SS21]MDC0661150.1 hypothetical protein [Marinobacter sp. SS21]
MQLNNLTIRFRRKRAATTETTPQPQPLALGRRQAMTLESLNRAAHSRSLKSVIRAR